MYRLLFLLLRIQLFSTASSAAILLASNGQVLYQIDVMQRGTEIINTFNSLAHVTGTKVPEVALQTNLIGTNLPLYVTYKYITNGIISYVQSLTPTMYNTLLIVTYVTPQTQGNNQYIVLPVEQVSAVLYFPKTNNLPTLNGAFNPGVISGTTPYFFVDPKLRAADIASAITQLIAAPFKSGKSQVWVQSTLTGPFNPPVVGGLLMNVTDVFTVSNTGLIQITFQPPSQPPLIVILSPEQVQQVIYVLNPNSP